MAHILVVDDYFEIAEWIKSILVQQGHDVEVCLSSIGAMQRLQEEEYDLVFMDIIMPEPDGLELCKYIREKLSEEKRTVPIIAISGGAASIDARVALSAASRYADMIMEKPLAPADIKKAVQHLLMQSGQGSLKI
jgi:CheY-like chemotaxis protein